MANEQRSRFPRQERFLGPDPRQVNLAGGMQGVCFQEPVTDPQGSWSGVPKDPYEPPVQDVDDL